MSLYTKARTIYRLARANPRGGTALTSEQPIK